MIQYMRHTLTLEPDVDAAVAEACKSSGKPMKEVINTLLRHALASAESLKTAPPMVIRPISMGGLRPGVSIDSISALESLIEEDLYK